MLITQTDLILNHMKEKGSITPIEALNLYGCLRLASRINELRNLGLEIKTTMVHKNDKRYARYSL